MSRRGHRGVGVSVGQAGLLETRCRAQWRGGRGHSAAGSARAVEGGHGRVRDGGWGGRAGSGDDAGGGVTADSRGAGVGGGHGPCGLSSGCSGRDEVSGGDGESLTAQAWTGTRGL